MSVYHSVVSPQQQLWEFVADVRRAPGWQGLVIYRGLQGCSLVKSTVFAKDLRLVLSTHVGQLTSLQPQDLILTLPRGSPGALRVVYICIYTQRDTHIQTHT